MNPTQIRNLEQRATRGQRVAVRDAGDDSPGTLYGNAIVFGVLSQDLGGFREIIAPGAVTKTVAETDVLALAYHDPTALLGRTSSGTVRLTVTPDALAYEIDVPDTTVGCDLATLVARGDVAGSSFGFCTVAASWDEADDGTIIRTVTELALHHIAPTPDPAYLDTSAALRSLAATRNLDLAAVEAAAKERNLRDLLAGVDPGNEHGDAEGEGRVSTPVLHAASYVF